MYHIVYLITNIVNYKIYVGIHSTYNLHDSYLGSGHAIKRAVKKYGKENFTKTILYVCLKEEDALFYESKIVDEQFLKRPDVYNIKLGGGCTAKYTDEIKNKFKLSWTDERKYIHSEKMKEKYINGALKLSKGYVHHKCKGRKQTDEHITKRTSKRIGTTHTNESKKKISESIEYLECPYCNKITTKSMITKFHKEKCKEFKRNIHDLYI